MDHDYNDLLIRFMKSKAVWMEEALAIPGDLYFNDGDRDEIRSWSSGDAEKIWSRIKRNIYKKKCTGLRTEFCPFCYFNGYKHRGCDQNTGAEKKAAGLSEETPAENVKLLHREECACLRCGYGKRHGLCISKNEEDCNFRKILNTFKDSRIDINRFFSTIYYKDLVEKLEKGD